jgi:hypothetical protein
MWRRARSRWQNSRGCWWRCLKRRLWRCRSCCRRGRRRGRGSLRGDRAPPARRAPRAGECYRAQGLPRERERERERESKAHGSSYESPVIVPPTRGAERRGYPQLVAFAFHQTICYIIEHTASACPPPKGGGRILYAVQNPLRVRLFQIPHSHQSYTTKFPVREKALSRQLRVPTSSEQTISKNLYSFCISIARGFYAHLLYSIGNG